MTAREPTGTLWRKSSYSADGDCVEVAPMPGCVLLRDSKDPGGPTLTVTTAAWRAFRWAVTSDRARRRPDRGSCG